MWSITKLCDTWIRSYQIFWHMTFSHSFLSERPIKTYRLAHVKPHVPKCHFYPNPLSGKLNDKSSAFLKGSEEFGSSFCLWRSVFSRSYKAWVMTHVSSSFVTGLRAPHPLYFFPVAAEINYQRPITIKQQKYIPSIIWRSEIWN
jgi:hypothetical protein